MARTLLFAILAAFFLTCIGSTDMQQKSESAVRKERRVNFERVSQNSFDKVDLSGNSYWRLEQAPKGELILNQSIEEGGIVNRYYIPRFNVFNILPRWKKQKDMIYSVGMDQSVPGNTAHKIERVSLKNLMALPERIEDIDFRKYYDIGKIESLYISPLDEVLRLITGTDKIRSGEPVYYDYAVINAEQGKLVFTADGNLSIWEYHLFGKENKTGKSKWSQVASYPSELNQRFEAVWENGAIELITENGEIWRADERNPFQKIQSAIIQREKGKARDSETVLIEDLDNQEYWLGEIPDDYEAVGAKVFRVRGGGKRSSDLVLGAVRKLASGRKD